MIRARIFTILLGLGVVLLCSAVLGFVLPSLLVGGADVIDVAVTAIVVGIDLQVG